MTDPANERSIRIARKLGYAPFREGVYKGKAVIIYSTFVPGGRSHSASRQKCV